MKIENLASKIKNIRLQSNLTQKEFAKLTGATQSTIARYEKGEREPMFSFFDNLFNNLNINPLYIFADIEPIYLTEQQKINNKYFIEVKEEELKKLKKEVKE